MRTWEQNKQAMNQLWPQCQWSDEERRLLKDDLSSLDHDVLYDALRNVKRTRDTLYPQLKWIMDEYRHLYRMKQFLLRPAPGTSEARKPVKICKESDARIGSELRDVIQAATTADKQEIIDLIADKASDLKIEMQTAYRLVRYLLERLGLAGGNVYGDAT